MESRDVENRRPFQGDEEKEERYEQYGIKTDAFITQFLTDTLIATPFIAVSGLAFGAT